MSVSAELSDIRVSFGKSEVLHGVSLTVGEGEFLTLLGPSGSGKTTALNVLAGFVTPTAGSVRLGGAPCDGVPPRERDLGFVFQSYALFPHMSVEDNVAFPLRVRGAGRRERRAAARRSLALVRLEQHATRRVGTLSGGQQQRVALARALAFEPRLLLLDEPLAALDKELRESMRRELRTLQRDVGVTTVAVTHDQTEALTMSDTIAILRDGRVEQVGTPSDLYERPASRFVASFLGEANLVTGRELRELRLLPERIAPPEDGRLAVLRPEDLDLRNGGAGRLEAASYEGSSRRLVVRSDIGTQLVVTVTRDHPAGALAVGDRVGVAFTGAHLHAVPAGREEVAR